MARPRSDFVMIHVCDENRKITRDFTCSRETLLAEMKYFHGYLSASAGTYDDIDISVHCDVHIFEWLIQFVTRKEAPPELDVASVISILISSDFLVMDELVPICLRFVRRHLNEIIKLPIDLNCLNDKLVLRLAALFSPSDLGGIVDARDKIVGKLYKTKLDLLLTNDDCALAQCLHCRRLYPLKHQSALVCPQAVICVSFHGDVVSRHTRCKKWNIQRYVLQLRQTMSWQAMYENVRLVPGANRSACL